MRLLWTQKRNQITEISKMKKVVTLLVVATLTTFTACQTSYREFSKNTEELVQYYDKYCNHTDAIGQDASLKCASSRLRDMSKYYEDANESTRNKLNDILNDNVTPEMIYTVYTYTLDYPDQYLIQPALVEYFREYIDDFQKQAAIESLKIDPAVGMTADEVRNSTWGSPTDISKTTTANNVSEMWSYDSSRYIFLDNGIVTSIHE